MYIYRYSELLAGTNTVETFVRALWALLGNVQRSGLGYDSVRIVPFKLDCVEAYSSYLARISIAEILIVCNSIL